MTVFQIEVQALAERYDVQAQQLARQILHLPQIHLPSLVPISASSTPLTHPTPLNIRTAQLYHLTGNLTSTQVDQLIAQLLVDPVVQAARSSLADTPFADDPHSYIVDVFFHPGVTDTLSESVLAGARMLGINGLHQVATGRRYFLDSRLTHDEVRTIAQALLYNPVIQHYILHGANENVGFPPVADKSAMAKMSLNRSDWLASIRPANEAAPLPCGSGGTSGARCCAATDSIASQGRNGAGAPTDCVGQRPCMDCVSQPVGKECNRALRDMSDEQLLELSKQGMLSLNLDEMHAIQQHYQEQGRDPTDVELETLAQTWSEHCSHKTFKATIHYREQDSAGNVLGEETISSLLKQYLMCATESIKPTWLVSAFSDNAGIVRFTQSQDIAFKVETHNHPSAIEPFGGANTGVGGVIRDVLGVSAQPIACTDILCFGPPDMPVEDFPAAVLSPRRITSGVVNGVRDYGNKMGIPTVNGAILYSEGYIYNPLVFCGCLGILPHGSHPHHMQPGDRIVVLGGRTGRDGIHGATFSSGEMSSEMHTQAGSAVQIGAPITEKKVADVILQARDRQLFSAITDCGAGGFSSAIGEMGAETGARVELAYAPLKYQGLAPWEIWLSEAQERMVLAVPPQHIEELLAICAIEEVEASIIGTFTNDHRLIVTYDGKCVADMQMQFLHEGRPVRRLEAVWVRNDGEIIHHPPAFFPPQSILLSLLRHPTISSKEAVVRRYDHEVQGATVLKPLVGRAGNGPGDAAVLQPILDEPSTAGIVLSNGINPLYGKIDPYHMAMNAVDEALRNMTAVGGDIGRAAILDNFCWGNPTDPVQLGMLVRAVKGCHDAAVGFGVPFISGKDSLNNEYRRDELGINPHHQRHCASSTACSGGVQGERIPVFPTLLISAVGVIEDAARTIDMSLKAPSSLLYQVGTTRNELAGSHYMEMVERENVGQPQTRAKEARVGESPAPSIHETVELQPEYSRGDPRGRPASQSPWQLGTTVPHVDVSHACALMRALGTATREGLVRACHDLSEGGLAVAAAEMALAGLLGVTIDVSNIAVVNPPDEIHIAETEENATAIQSAAINTILLFSESASRFLIEIAPEQRDAFEAQMRAFGVADFVYIGMVNETQRFVLRNADEILIDLSISDLQEAWRGESA